MREPVGRPWLKEAGETRRQRVLAASLRFTDVNYNTIAGPRADPAAKVGPGKSCLPRHPPRLGPLFMERQRDASACMRRHRASALALVS
jgi:hypothetical protein